MRLAELTSLGFTNKNASVFSIHAHVLESQGREASVAIPGNFNAFDDRARLVCAVALAAVISVLSRPLALALAMIVAIVPVALALALTTRGKNFTRFARTLSHLNLAGLLMAALLVLTMPDKREGFKLSALILVRLNLISIILFYGVLSLGLSRVYSTLALLRCPEKLRLLLFFTLYGIRVLSDRERSLVTALRLRAPNLHGLLKWRTFAALLGSILLQGVARSERTMTAVLCRGGFAGFDQTAAPQWRRLDTVLCAATLLLVGAMLFLEF